MPTKPTSRFAEIDDKLAAAAAAQTRCKICVFITDPATPKVDAQYVDDLLRAPLDLKSHAHVVRVLSEGELEVSDSTVKRHRSKHLS